jgi:uncharacterized protein (TIGR02217 family)
MKNFHDILLPEFLNTYLKGGPSFATSCAQSISGREMRIAEREYALQKYNLSGSRINSEQFERFNCFFRCRKGMNYAFRAKDYADFKLENQIIGLPNDRSLSFEIFKKYDDNISTYQRRIRTLRPETVKCNMDVRAIDYINGIIFMNEALKDGQQLIINGEFDVIVRFCSDEFKYSFCQDGSILIDDLALQEVL